MSEIDININDRIKVIKPPVEHPGLLGSKLRVVGMSDGYVDVMASTVTVRQDWDDVEFAEPEWIKGWFFDSKGAPKEE